MEANPKIKLYFRNIISMENGSVEDKDIDTAIVKIEKLHEK